MKVAFYVNVDIPDHTEDADKWAGSAVEDLVDCFSDDIEVASAGFTITER